MLAGLALKAFKVLKSSCGRGGKSIGLRAAADPTISGKLDAQTNSGVEEWHGYFYLPSASLMRFLTSRTIHIKLGCKLAQIALK